MFSLLRLCVKRSIVSIACFFLSKSIRGTDVKSYDEINSTIHYELYRFVPNTERMFSIHS